MSDFRLTAHSDRIARLYDLGLYNSRTDNQSPLVQSKIVANRSGSISPAS